MTLKELTEEYNVLRRSIGMEPLAAWKGSKESLRRRIEELRGGQARAPRVGQFVRAELEAVDGETGRGRPYEEILARVKGAFPAARTSIKCVRWYAKDLRRRGCTLPVRPRSRREAPCGSR